MTTSPKKSLDSYARYSGIAIQMMVIIAGGAFGGFYLDRWLGTKPVLTVILSLCSVIIAIYLVIRDLLKKKT